MVSQLMNVFIDKGLSRRESEVAELVSTGLSNKEIGEKLFVTEKTVKFHLTNIFKKLGVRNRANLIVLAAPYLSFIENEKGEPETPETPVENVEAEIKANEREIPSSLPMPKLVVGAKPDDNFNVVIKPDFAIESEA